MVMLKQAGRSGEPAHSRLSASRIEELLDAAAEVFFEQGFEGASVGEMARRARASKGTYYSRYLTKEQLFGAVIQRVADRFSPPLAGLLLLDEDVATTLEKFGQRLLTLALSPQAIQVQRVISMEACRFPDLGWKFYEAGHGASTKLLANYLRKMTLAGRLSVPHPKIVAAQVIDALTGGVVHRAVLGVGKLSAKERHQRVHLAVEAFLRAYTIGPRVSLLRQRLRTAGAHR